jgi:hypothetical protein
VKYDENNVHTISYLNPHLISAIVNNYSVICISIFSTLPICNNVCRQDYVCVVNTVSRDQQEPSFQVAPKQIQY